VIGAIQPQLPNLTYEPIGVALFAVGVLYLYLERFEVIRLAADTDEPVLLLDDSNRIREYNEPAADLFPDVAAGEAIETAAPTLGAYLGADSAEVVEVERVGGVRYYQLTTNQFASEIPGLGAAITLTDITEREQHQAELERQNERLNMFAQTISHDLRNPLNVAMGRLAVAREEDDSEHLQTVQTALSRMETLITDVLALAKQGEDVTDLEPVSLIDTATQAWAVVETGDVALVTSEDLRFEADADRLEQVLENLFRNAIDHGGPDVTVRIGALDGNSGFYVEDDGGGIPEDKREQVFELGHSTEADGTGFGLAIVAEIVTAHDWTITVTESSNGGARFEIMISNDDS
jgi:signal transduction histidine kinase